MFHKNGPTFWELAVQAMSSTERGYDLLADAVDVGRHVIPIVREEVAKRDLAAAGTGRTAV